MRQIYHRDESEPYVIKKSLRCSDHTHCSAFPVLGQKSIIRIKLQSVNKQHEQS